MHVSTDDVTAVRMRLDQVEQRIKQACKRSGRSRDEITLIGVTKTFPPSLIAAAIEAGLREFGENKVQELIAKVPQIPKGRCRWHMIGHLQRNKARQVAQHADSFHALDSVRLAEALNRHAGNAGRVVPCFVQVNVSGEKTKFGFGVKEASILIEQMDRFANLQLRGLMTLAAPSPEPEVVRGQFRSLRRLAQRYAHRGCTALSMGMSGDFEAAIEEGATHVRIGSAIFGARL